jgi:hypothetical protein
MHDTPEQAQFLLSAIVYHGSDFGHRLEMIRTFRGRDESLSTPLGRWKGLGIPEDVLRTSSALIVAAWEEHLITRYGVAGELPLTWSGEPDPF